MSGAHLPICEKLIAALNAEDMRDVLIVVGGVIPMEDIERLKALGINAVYPGGTPLDDIVEGIKTIAAAKM